ncbi:ubiquitin carboxyl-terminal hydrolase [Volvox africanus]|uniref:Ubiquitin carboxyl-terminal hydrolase n=1 Tax=Volvox africanus TaxID=51714 RepID=A0ABQ5RZT6_9CHLO|nr:ubiquitin carboxyl-terminal hydrolase [Volvox africanus]
MEWTTIESDPGVFTELIEQIGVKGVQVEELWSLDQLRELSPVFGLIFLFKWKKETEKRQVSSDAHGVFFAKQVIRNACATQAILSILLNRPELDLGTELTNFREFVADFDPTMRGLAISNSDLIRTTHNSFSRPEPLVPDEDEDDEKGGEAYHFVSYVPVGGRLYELDGLQEGPIELCECSTSDWLDRVGPHIATRIERYAANEIRFNLMALVGNRLDIYSSRLTAATARRDELAAAVAEAAAAVAADDAAALTHAQLIEVEVEVSSLQEALAIEQAKHRAWRDENVRRKHNYLPFLFNLLKLMASRGELMQLVERQGKPT